MTRNFKHFIQFAKSCINLCLAPRKVVETYIRLAPREVVEMYVLLQGKLKLGTFGAGGSCRNVRRQSRGHQQTFAIETVSVKYGRVILIQTHECDYNY